MNNVLNEMNVLFEKIENTNEPQVFNDVLKKISLFCKNPKNEKCLCLEIFRWSIFNFVVQP